MAFEDPETPRGRPSRYSTKIAQEICEELAAGKSLRSICRDDRFPHESTVRLWAVEDREGFSTQYARARDIGYQCMAEELLDIADGTDGEDANRDRLRVDTRKWFLSKALPKLYGDKTTTEVVGKDGGPIQTIDASKLTEKQLAALASIRIPADSR